MSSDVLNLLAHISANEDKVKTAVIAVVFQPEEGQDDPPAEILTLGDNAAHIFGICDIVKMSLFKQLGDPQ